MAIDETATLSQIREQLEQMASERDAGIAAMRSTFSQHQVAANIVMIDKPSAKDKRDAQFVIMAVTETGHLARVSVSRAECITLMHHFLEVLK